MPVTSSSGTNPGGQLEALEAHTIGGDQAVRIDLAEASDAVSSRIRSLSLYTSDSGPRPGRSVLFLMFPRIFLSWSEFRIQHFKLNPCHSRQGFRRVPNDSEDDRKVFRDSISKARASKLKQTMMQQFGL